MFRPNPHIAVLVTVLLASAPISVAREGVRQTQALSTPSVENPADDKFFMALESFVNSLGTKPMETFIDDWIDEAYVAELGRDALMKKLEAVRKACANPGGIMIHPGATETALTMTFESGSGRWDLHLKLSVGESKRIRSLTMEKGKQAEPIAPFTWDNVGDRLQQYEADGFAGSVMLVRDGKVVLNEGYGFANEQLEARNTPDTIYAVGSTPIDFTHVAILFLEECGRLHTNDLVSKYIDDVPEDKAAMTLGHLMTGRSGLRNFHGIRGVDEDMDLSYIDREEALRRILGSPLLFAPGQGREHSHSAWGVLAAVIEIVSEQSYGEFLQENLFEPAGMKSTGLYPHTLTFDDKLIAVGQAPPALGKPNTPKNWGPTSWLVMGSGGMVSSTADFYRWMQALRAGKILAPEQQKRFFQGQVLSGGNDRGFMTVYTQGPGDLVILCSNSSFGLDDLSWDIGYALANLVQGPGSKR